MPIKKNKLVKKLLLSLFLVLGLVIFAACSANSGSGSNSNSPTEASDHAMDEGNSEHEHDSDARIPNPGGATITLLSPADGDTFAQGDEVNVEVKVDNFALGEDGSHWHVYVDGTSWGMVEGGNTSQTLHGLDSGEHELAVYLAGGDHVEFEDGDSIHITVQ